MDPVPVDPRSGEGADHLGGMSLWSTGGREGKGRETYRRPLFPKPRDLSFVKRKWLDNNNNNNK